MVMTNLSGEDVRFGSPDDRGCHDRHELRSMIIPMVCAACAARVAGADRAAWEVDDG
jgi:hypothetical protein